MGIFSKKRVPAANDDADARLFAAAIMTGDPNLVRSAIRQGGVDVNRAAEDGTPPVVLAAAKGNEAVVDELLSAGADVNQPDRRGGITALHAAVTSGQETIVRKLIARGANLNASFGQPPMTPLGVAFRKAFRNIVSELLRAGADPNVTINGPLDPPAQGGTTPLMYAASVGDIEMLRLFMRHGANVDAPKADGLTPLMAAAANGQMDIVKALVEDGGAKVNVINGVEPRRTVSAIDLAEAGGHRSVASYLRTRGAISTSPAS